MVKVDYISTKDINKVSKIHSSKKYAGWLYKIVDDEYRFYPPLEVDYDEELDYFDFADEFDDDIELDNIELESSNVKCELPIIGELWNKTFKFLNDPIADIKFIRKSSDRKIKLDRYSEKFSDNYKVVKNSSTKIKKDKYTTFESYDDNYKLYHVTKNNNCISKLNRYKNEIVESELRVSHNEASKAKIDKFFKRIDDELEMIVMDRNVEM